MERVKQLLNTLYVTTQGAYLARDGDTVAVRVEHETKLRVPIHTLEQHRVLRKRVVHAVPDGAVRGKRGGAIVSE